MKLNKTYQKNTKAIEEQAELKELINKLNEYGPRISIK